MGMFNSFVEMSGIGNFGSGAMFSDAELQETMNMLEDIEEAVMPDNITDCFIEAAVANEHNFNLIMTSVANEEMNYFMEHGVEMVYEEGKIEAFFDKIKNFIKKAWEKIKAIFAKVKAWLESKLSSDKAFLKNHGDTIKSLNAEKCKITGYAINTENVYSASAYEKLLGTLDEVKEMNKDDKADDILDVARALIVGGSKVSSSDFSDKLDKYFGIGSSNETVKMDGDDVYNEIRDGKLMKKGMNAGYNLAKKTIAALLKYADIMTKINKKTENDYTKDNTSNMSSVSKVLNGYISILNTVQSKHVRAMNILHSQARKIAANAVKEKNKKDNKSTNESASIMDAFM